MLLQHKILYPNRIKASTESHVFVTYKCFRAVRKLKTQTFSLIRCFRLLHHSNGVNKVFSNELDLDPLTHTAVTFPLVCCAWVYYELAAILVIWCISTLSPRNRIRYVFVAAAEIVWKENPNKKNLITQYILTDASLIRVKKNIVIIKKKKRNEHILAG